MKRLAIVTSHPIQYNAPWFKLLANEEGIQLKVFYTWEQSAGGNTFDPGFGKKITWDIPLLEGYEFSFTKNVSDNPGTHHFKGIITPFLNAEIEQWKPDVLLVIGWSFDGHLRCLRYFHKKVPIVFRGDSTLLDEKPGLRRIIRRLSLRWVFRYIDYALYVGTNNKQYFLKHGLKESQLAFAPHAIDNERFSDGADVFEEEALKWRLESGFGKDDIIILFAGKFEPKKNPFFILQLADRLKEHKITFLLIGNGPLEPALKEAAKDNPRIRFMDFQNQGRMPLVYRLGDVFILPSTGPGETWGLAINEASACSRPLMVSNKAGCAIDLVRQDKNGIIFSGDNVEGCVEFLIRLARDKDRIKLMGSYSRQIIDQYSFQHLIGGVKKIIQKLS